jgi:hypothetical protein
MTKEETQEEKRIRELSEKRNPYFSDCLNRHLWSEGFRVGYKIAIAEHEAGQWSLFPRNHPQSGYYTVTVNEVNQDKYETRAYYAQTGEWYSNGNIITKKVVAYKLPAPFKEGGEG